MPLLIRFLLGISAVLLGLGLSLPVMKVIPRLGPFHDYFSFFLKDLNSPQSFSLLEGIRTLTGEGHYFIAVIILIFSVIFPLWKLGVLWVGFSDLIQQKRPGRAFYLAEKLGKYSMVDVFVIALLVVSIKGLPGGSRVVLQSGLFFFALSVLTVMLASWLIEKTWSSQSPNSDESTNLSG